MCKMSGVLRQDQQTSWQGVPHVLVPRYVRKYTVFNNLERGEKWMRFDVRSRENMLALCSKVAVVLIWYKPAPHSPPPPPLLSQCMRVLKLNINCTAVQALTHLSLNILAVCNDRICASHCTPTGGVHAAAEVAPEALCLADLRPTAQLSPRGEGFPSTCIMYRI